MIDPAVARHSLAPHRRPMKKTHMLDSARLVARMHPPPDFID
jgi:hypothetical protein